MNVGLTLFNQKPSDMSRFSRVIYFGTTEHTDDMDEKEIPHQVLWKCDATLCCLLGTAESSGGRPKREVPIRRQERPRFGVRRCSTALSN
jgi:hypothetical protein